MELSDARRYYHEKRSFTSPSLFDSMEEEGRSKQSQHCTDTLIKVKTAQHTRRNAGESQSRE
jgi:hypothetical protein